MQETLFKSDPAFRREVSPFKLQLLKWVGNKQRFAHEIASYFPSELGTFYEPFFGSGAVSSVVAPALGRGSDVFRPLVEIWQTLKDDPEKLVGWYRERWHAVMDGGDKKAGYEQIKASFNAAPNGADLLFLCRSCYGGVVRFRKADGYMSTPCGVHRPVEPASFAARAEVWARRLRGMSYDCLGYEESMRRAVKGDMVYCDPPYIDSQAILYGAQAFSLERLFEVIEVCKSRGVSVALSIDGTKRSGDHVCDVSIPKGLFEREVFVNCGRSMLKRFQMQGETLEDHVVADRLLLTY